MKFFNTDSLQQLKTQFKTQIRPYVKSRGLQTRIKKVMDKVPKPLEAWRDRAADFLTEWLDIRGLMDRSTFEVKPSDEGWRVIDKTTNEEVKTYIHKREAIRAAKRLAREQHAAVDVFTKQGTIQNHFSY